MLMQGAAIGVRGDMPREPDWAFALVTPGSFPRGSAWSL